MDSLNTDVVVIGAGGAGLVAALTAAEGGADPRFERSAGRPEDGSGLSSTV